MKTSLFAFGVLLLVPVCLLLGGRAYASYMFKRDCGGWLKLAADASSVATARERLDKAVTHLESNRLVDGNTSLIFTTPENDVGVWYRNLKSAEENLDTFPADATEADVNTALSKLRETVLDHGPDGDYVTRPDYIDIYPHVWVWAGAFCTSVLLGLVGLGMIMVSKS